MKFYIKILCLIIFSTINIFSQEIKQPKENQFVLVPREEVLQVVAVQPDSPIKFENVHYLAGIEGGFGNSYQLRNIGVKPIRSVTVASSTGAVNAYGGETGTLMLPGQMMQEICVNCRKPEIVPLTNELRTKLGLNGQMHGIVTLMVVEAEFTDGTKYSDKKTYEEMVRFWDEITDALYLQKQQIVKKP